MRGYHGKEISGLQVQRERLYQTSSVVEKLVEYIGLCFTFCFLFSHGSLFRLKGQWAGARVSWGKEVLENTE